MAARFARLRSRAALRSCLGTQNTLAKKWESNEQPITFAVWNAVFQENWANVRHIKSERIWFTNIFSIITAGALSLLHVGGEAVPQLLLIGFMCVFSLMGLLTSLRLKAELEECLEKLVVMAARANVKEFIALERSEGQLARYPQFRWIFPAFYSISLFGFVALLVYRLVVGGAIR